MPMVPTFNREDLPQIQQTGPQADPNAAGIVGATLARGGASLSAEASDYLRQHIEQLNYDYTATNIAAARTQATDNFLRRSAAAQKSGNYEGITSATQQEMQTDLQQRLQTAPTQRAADTLTKMYANLQDEFTTKASLFEGEGNERNASNNVDQNVGRSVIVALRDPTQADAAMGQATAIIRGAAAAGLGQVAADTKLRLARNEIYGAAAQGILNQDRGGPARLLQALKAGQFDNVLSEQQLVAFQAAAQDRVNAQQAEARRQASEDAILMRGSVESAFRDNLASLHDTGRLAVPLTRAQIAAAYPRDPERVDAMVNAQDLEQKGFVARSSVALSAPADDAALLARLRPAGPGYAAQADVYNGVLTAIQQKQKALTADPAAYVQGNSPQLRALFQAAKQDPAQLPKAVAAQDSMYDHLGLTPDQRPVLTQGGAAAVVAKLTSGDPTKMDAGTVLDQMAQAYGPVIWPRVFQDLVHANLPGSYQALAAMDAPAQAAARQTLQRANAMDAQKPKALENLTEAASATFKTAIPDALAEFARTAVIPGAALNSALLANVGASVTTLARTYVLAGDDPNTAVAKAYDDVVGKKYDFDGTMRVPKGMLPEVHAAADQALEALKPEDLQATAKLPPGIAADQLASAKRSAAWFPNAADDGLMLLTRTRDGTWIRVNRADGTPVQIKFADAAKALAARPETPPPDLEMQGP